MDNYSTTDWLRMAVNMLKNENTLGGGGGGEGVLVSHQCVRPGVPSVVTVYLLLYSCIKSQGTLSQTISCMPFW